MNAIHSFYISFNPRNVLDLKDFFLHVAKLWFLRKDLPFFVFTKLRHIISRNHVKTSVEKLFLTHDRNDCAMIVRPHKSNGIL